MDKNTFVKFFFPQKCMFCGDIAEDNGICNKCLKKAEHLKIPDQARTINHTCFKNLNKCISFYYYKDEIRDSIIYAKFKNCGRFLDGFLHCIPIDFTQFCADNSIDMIISMPAHKSKFYSQEYDLPQEMARRIAKHSNLQYNKNVILKIKKTKNQHDLSLNERKSNLREAFKLNKYIKGKRILLIDDIVSTGYSLEEAAKCLKKGGAAAVTAVTFAYNRL